MEKIVEWTLPIKTVSESNSTGHWANKSARHKVQRRWIKAAFLRDRPQINSAKLLRIVLVRIAPRNLDSNDNLPMSFKWILDAICDRILPGLAPGQADNKLNFEVEYKQEKGQPKTYEVRVEIYGDQL